VIGVLGHSSDADRREHVEARVPESGMEHRQRTFVGELAGLECHGSGSEDVLEQGASGGLVADEHPDVAAERSGRDHRRRDLVEDLQRRVRVEGDDPLRIHGHLARAEGVIDGSGSGHRLDCVVAVSAAPDEQAHCTEPDEEVSTRRRLVGRASSNVHAVRGFSSRVMGAPGSWPGGTTQMVVMLKNYDQAKLTRGLDIEAQECKDSLSWTPRGGIQSAVGRYRRVVPFTVTCTDDAVRVGISGWDRVVTWRRVLTVDLATVCSAFIESRGVLEAHIDHRVAGFGTHDGAGRPGRRRVGTMLGSGVQGPQFWAVSAGPSTMRLLVLDLQSGPFTRVVLHVDADVAASVIAAVVSC
jgi:hypothetical protein